MRVVDPSGSSFGVLLAPEFTRPVLPNSPPGTPILLSERVWLQQSLHPEARRLLERWTRVAPDSSKVRLMQ
jgi:hypothetical protein